VPFSRSPSPSVFSTLRPRAPASRARPSSSAWRCPQPGWLKPSHRGSAKVTNRPGTRLSNRSRLSSSPLPDPPVAFTIIRTFFLSITGRSVSGRAAKLMPSRPEKPRWVWTSITGKRARSTRVAGTWSMLRGWNSVMSRRAGAWEAA